MDKKQTIRQKMLKQLKTQDKDERARKSAEIKAQLFASEGFKRAKVIMFYASLGYEVDTFSMIENAINDGKKVCLPCVSKEARGLKPYRFVFGKDELVKGPYSVRQPKECSDSEVPAYDIDLVIVPGIAFDRCGNRLGHGKGYYDRFLSHLPRSVFSIGLAFNFQIKERLPVSSYDFPVNKVLSA